MRVSKNTWLFIIVATVFSVLCSATVIYQNTHQHVVANVASYLRTYGVRASEAEIIAERTFRNDILMSLNGLVRTSLFTNRILSNDADDEPQGSLEQLHRVISLTQAYPPRLSLSSLSDAELSAGYDVATEILEKITTHPPECSPLCDDLIHSYLLRTIAALDREMSRRTFRPRHGTPADEKFSRLWTDILRELAFSSSSIEESKSTTQNFPERWNIHALSYYHKLSVLQLFMRHYRNNFTALDCSIITKPVFLNAISLWRNNFEKLALIREKRTGKPTSKFDENNARKLINEFNNFFDQKCI